MSRRSPAVLVALVALGAVACSGDDGSAEGGSTPSTTSAPASTSLYDLEVGDCFSGLDRVQDIR